MKRNSTFIAIAVCLSCSAVATAQYSSSGTNSRPSTGASQGSTAQSGSATHEQGAATDTSNATRTTPARTRATRQSSRAAEQAASRAQEITLTGCLQGNETSNQQASNAAATGQQKRRAQANAAPTFILNNASQSTSATGTYAQSPKSGTGSQTTQAGNASSQGSRTVGTSGTSNPSSIGNNSPSTAQNTPSSSQINTGAGSYVLQGLDLTRQVGQQVEVTGQLVPASTTRRGRSATAASAGADAQNASMQRVRVTSARMISAHCGSSNQ